MPGFDVGSGVGGRGCARVNEAAPPATDALRLRFFVRGVDLSFLQNLLLR